MIIFGRPPISWRQQPPEWSNLISTISRFAYLTALITATHALAMPMRNDAVRELMTMRHLEGAVLVQDVRTGAIVVDVETGGGRGEGILPLSTTKVFLAAMAWDRQLKTAVSLHWLIAHGVDDDGRRVALDLRHAYGSQAVLGDLARFGFPVCRDKQSSDCFSLSAKTSDSDWASTLSIGEASVRVTLKGLSAFLRIIGRDGTSDYGRLLKASTARALQSAMLDTVRQGSAQSIRGRSPDGCSIGGKTGTGPGTTHPYNGIFAGLCIDAAGRGLYTFVVYIRHGGRGGVVPAMLAADVLRGSIK